MKNLTNKIKKFIKGCISLEVKGFGKERLINVCKKNNIIFNNFKFTDTGYSFQVNTNQYKKILYYNQKIGTDILVTNQSGLKYLFKKHKKRKIFILCFFLFMFTIYIFSNYIWNISIIGSEIYTKEELIKDVNNNFAPIGTAKKNINCNELEKKLRLKYQDIAWISCEIKGTNLVINIEETIPSDKIITFNEPCNIISYKNAIITDIVINKGTRIVNQGDEIKKNDILITGVVNIVNEYDELIESSYIPASGTVWGIVEYNYNDTFSIESSKKEYTGNTNNSHIITIADKPINLFSKKSNYSNYDIISSSNNLKLFKNLYLPIGITTKNYKEYNITSYSLTEDEAYDLAKERLINYIEKLKKKGVSIIENNVKINIVDGKCHATGTLKCKEVISIPSKLEITQEGE